MNVLEKGYGFKSMKKIILFLICFIAVFQPAMCQITKGNNNGIQLLEDKEDFLLYDSAMLRIEKIDKGFEDLSIREKIRYNISTEKTIFAPGEPIIVNATFVNITNSEFCYLSTFQPLWDIRPAVFSNDDQKTPYTKYGELVFSDMEKGLIDFTRLILSPLYPEEMKRGKLLINRIYDFTKLGTYQIQLRRTFIDKENPAHCRVFSNILEVEIAENNDDFPTIHYIDEIRVPKEPAEN